MQELFLGIDLGGSGMRASVYDRAGQLILLFGDIEFEASPGKDIVAQSIESIIHRSNATKYINKGQVVAWGLASPGPLDPFKGVIETPPNLGIRNFKVVEHIESKFPDLKGYLVNDADAALFAEFRYGAGRGFSHIIGVFAGTGLGSANMTHGHLQRGCGKGPEWGHNPIYYFGEVRKCVCGRINCLEAYVGTSGLARTYCSVLNKAFESMTREEIFQVSANLRSISRNHDKDQCNNKIVLAKYACQLSQGIFNVVIVHNPECVILGGGIIEGNVLLLQYIKAELNLMKGRTYMGHLLENLVIKTTELENPGSLGAAAYAMDKHDSYKFGRLA